MRISFASVRYSMLWPQSLVQRRGPAVEAAIGRGGHRIRGEYSAAAACQPALGAGRRRKWRRGGRLERAWRLRRAGSRKRLTDNKVRQALPRCLRHLLGVAELSPMRCECQRLGALYSGMRGILAGPPDQMGRRFIERYDTCERFD